MSRILSVLAGAAVAAFGALVAGEYDYQSLVPLFAGVALGLLVSEAVALGGQWRGWGPAGIAAALAVAGVLWGGWISSGNGVAAYPSFAWVGAALAAAVALVRARPRPVKRRPRSAAPDPPRR